MKKIEQLPKIEYGVVINESGKFTCIKEESLLIVLDTIKEIIEHLNNHECFCDCEPDEDDLMNIARIAYESQLKELK